MIVINRILGNHKTDPVWQSKLEGASIDALSLSEWEAQKSRCRKTTKLGQDLGIALNRSEVLSDGDILLWDEKGNTAVVVDIQLRDVMVISVHSLLSKDPSELLKMSFNLGHALGNQHWNSVVKDEKVYVPLVVTTKVMETVLKSHGFDFPCSFVKGEKIIPLLSQSEARLLFGGAEDASSHVHVANGFQVSRTN